MRHEPAQTRAELKVQPAGYAFATAAYDHFQVIYVTEGRLHCRFAGTDQVLTAGAGVVLRVGSAFRLSCREVGYHGVAINIFSPVAGICYGESVAFVGNRALHALAELIQQEIALPDAGADEVLTGLGMALGWHALRLAGASVQPSESAREWAERARQAILATLTTGRGIRDVLGALPLSYRQLVRHFSAHFGITPKQYQQQCRLAEVQRLLRDTSVNITTIAHEFGYPSSQHLSTQFHQATGLTPMAYRRQQREILLNTLPVVSGTGVSKIVSLPNCRP